MIDHKKYRFGKQQARYLYYAAMAVTFLFMVYKTWCRFGNLIIDTFRDQIVADKLAHGYALYKDVYYLFGILPPYILALLNRIFGTSLYCSIGLGMVITLLSAHFIYRLCRLYLNRAFSTIAVLNFFSTYAFNDLQGIGLFNFILPYSVASYFAILFVLASLFFFIKYVHNGKQRDLFLWAVASYIIFLSRVEVALVCYGVFVVSGLLLSWRRRRPVLSVMLMPLIAAVASYAAYLIPTGSWDAYKESVLRMVFFESRGYDPYAHFNLGIINVMGDGSMVPAFALNLWIMAKTFIMQTIVMFILCIAGGYLSVFSIKPAPAPWNKITKAVSYIMFGVISFALIYVFRPVDQSVRIISYTSTLMAQYNLGSFADICLLQLCYFSTPLILLAAIIVISLFIVRSGQRENRQLYSMLILSVLSLFLLARIMFRVTPYANGNYLLIPGNIVIYIFFLIIIPKVWKQIADVSADTKYYKIACALYFLVSAYGFGSENIAVANYKTCQLAYARGTINAFNDQTTTPFMETVDYVKQCTPQSASLLVFPEGNGINYLSGRFCPMRYDNYLPNILNTVGEDKIVRELNEHPSDFVVLVHRNTYEHGYRKFGFDYGMQIVAWINCNYEPVALIGDMPFSDSAVFGTAIYRKKAVHGKPK